jgi:hypothetical protein
MIDTQFKIPPAYTSHSKSSTPPAQCAQSAPILTFAHGIRPASDPLAPSAEQHILGRTNLGAVLFGIVGSTTVSAAPLFEAQRPFTRPRTQRTRI